MRVRQVNEKALSNMIAFLEDVQKHQKSNIKFSSTELQVKHGVSKSSWSIIKKLGGMEATREYALKILEILRLRFDKSTDAPINDAWLEVVADIKRLMSQMIDNTSKNNNRSEGLKIPQISERVYLAGQIMYRGMEKYNNFVSLDIDNINSLCDKSIQITDILLNKLNKK